MTFEVSKEVENIDTGASFFTALCLRHTQGSFMAVPIVYIRPRRGNWEDNDREGGYIGAS